MKNQAGLAAPLQSNIEHRPRSPSPRYLQLCYHSKSGGCMQQQNGSSSSSTPFMGHPGCSSYRFRRHLILLLLYTDVVFSPTLSPHLLECAEQGSLARMVILSTLVFLLLPAMLRSVEFGVFGYKYAYCCNTSLKKHTNHESETWCDFYLACSFLPIGGRTHFVFVRDPCHLKTKFRASKTSRNMAITPVKQGWMSKHRLEDGGGRIANL